MKSAWLIVKVALLASLFFTVNSAYAEAQAANSDIMKADANHDGKVSFYEYEAAHKVRLKERFNRRDLNQDGFVDLEEKKIVKEKKKAQRKAEKIEEKEKLREKHKENRKKRRKHFYKYQ